MSFAKENLAKEKKGDDNYGSLDDDSLLACSRKGEKDHRWGVGGGAKHGAPGPGQAGATAIPATAAAQPKTGAFRRGNSAYEKAGADWHLNPA